MRPLFVSFFALAVGPLSILLPFSSSSSSWGTHALDNGLGLVPPMGWNSWNKFHCDIHEHVIRQTADRLLSLGLADVGYRYVNLDDCWMAPNRTSTPEHEYQADPYKFPSGMVALGQYLHNRNLKFGIYTSAGTHTCQGLPGSMGHEWQDAQTFASWGVDYLKYDSCYNEGVPAMDRFPKMRDALNHTGRPIFYSLCQGGKDNSWRWAPLVGNSWRTTTDIQDNWQSIQSNFISSQQSPHYTRSGPGAWADPDMLEVGNGHLTHDEEKSHFALWVMVKAPLLLGMNLSDVSAESVAIVSNRNLLAIHQDPQWPPATCFVGCASPTENITMGDWSVYATTIRGGDTVALLINWSDDVMENVTFAAQDVGVVPMTTTDQVTIVTDLWTDEEMGNYTFQELQSIVTPSLASHGSVVYRFSTMSTKVEEVNATPQSNVSKRSSNANFYLLGFAIISMFT